MTDDLRDQLRPLIQRLQNAKTRRIELQRALEANAVELGAARQELDDAIDTLTQQGAS